MTNTTTDLQARMEALVRRMAEKTGWIDLSNVNDIGYFQDARAIVAELPKPIDEDVLAVREILSAWEKSSGLSDGLMSGECDSSFAFQRALAAYKLIKAGWQS